MSKYCFEVCPKGKEMKDYLLDNNNSVKGNGGHLDTLDVPCKKTS